MRRSNTRYHSSLPVVAFVLLSMALTLPGCAVIQKTWDTVETVISGEVSRKAAIVAANSFNALKATATNYIRLPRCQMGGSPVCRDPQVAAIIIPAIDSGTIARNGLIGFYRQYPEGKTVGAQGLYNALLTTNKTLESIYDRYQIGRR